MNIRSFTIKEITNGYTLTIDEREIKTTFYTTYAGALDALTAHLTMLAEAAE